MAKIIMEHAAALLSLATAQDAVLFIADDAGQHLFDAGRTEAVEEISQLVNRLETILRDEHSRLARGGVERREADRRDGPRRLVSRLGSGRRGGTDPRKPVVTTARDERVTAPRLPSDWPSPDAVEAFADAYRSWLGE